MSKKKHYDDVLHIKLPSKLKGELRDHCESIEEDVSEFTRSLIRAKLDEQKEQRK